VQAATQRPEHAIHIACGDYLSDRGSVGPPGRMQIRAVTYPPRSVGRRTSGPRELRGHAEDEGEGEGGGAEPAARNKRHGD
jgi:hypothetical protein